MITFYKLYSTGSISSGSYSINTLSTKSMLKQILIETETSGTVFDFSITDSDNIVIFEETSVTGKLNLETSIPADGIQTLNISNATNDEDITIKLMYKEN